MMKPSLVVNIYPQMSTGNDYKRKNRDNFMNFLKNKLHFTWYLVPTSISKR